MVEDVSQELIVFNVFAQGLAETRELGGPRSDWVAASPRCGSVPIPRPHIPVPARYCQGN